jgi:fermentation-respiration switch protein FrsA (DUF1100 family)
VPRRTPLILVLVLALTAGCSPSNPPTADPARPASTPSAALSSPAPDRSEKSEPRRAPADDLPIARRELDFQRGKDRPLPTTVWYPTEGEKPFPLIVFSHGLTSEPAAYESVLKPWAEAGFVVAAPKFPHTRYRAPEFDETDVLNQPADVSEVITRMLATDTDGLIDRSRIAAAGHSAGGITTIGLFTGNRDDRLSAGIVLSGQQVLGLPFTGAPARMLFVHGKLDTTVRYRDGLAAFNAVPWPKAMLTVTQGGHVAITKDFLPVVATTTDFLRYALYDDADAKLRLGDDATKGDRATLINKL